MSGRAAGLGCAFYGVVILLGAVAWLTIFVLVRALASRSISLHTYDVDGCYMPRV